MPETHPDLSPRCSRCGADAIIPDAFLVAEGVGTPKMSVGIYTKPTAMIMKGPVKTEVQFRVCGDCGLIEAEAADPRLLWEAYVDRLSREFD